MYVCVCVRACVCVCDILINPDKSDVSVYGTRSGLKRRGLHSSISVVGCAIDVCERLKILGVALDATLSFDDHITSVVRECNFNLCHIRCSVSRDIAGCSALLFDKR